MLKFSQPNKTRSFGPCFKWLSRKTAVALSEAKLELLLETNQFDLNVPPVVHVLASYCNK